MYGIAMHGEPALAPDFSHLSYVNPDAPKGGRVVFGELGGFDSLNPYVLKGTAPWAIREHVMESLMARNWDEPFALYGLLAKSITTPPDRSWVIFTLRPEARFSDGSPVTVDDVIWSFQMLRDKGHPRFHSAMSSIKEITAISSDALKITFKDTSRELPMILGLMPIFSRAQWQTHDFATDVVPLIGSGPYVIADYEPGRFIEFHRNPDWWGRDLPVNRGLNNFDVVRYEFFRNDDALWEAVRAGKIAIFSETDPVRWAENYDFPAMRNGRLKRGEFTNQRPSGMEGFVFNTRRKLFENWSVRKALALSFDWDWVNARLFRGQYRRIESYFGFSALGWRGPAQGAEAALLRPFAADLPPHTLQHPWSPPSAADRRRNLRMAADLLARAGWTVRDGRRQDANGTAMTFEILVASVRDETMANLWRADLARLGITARVRLVDQVQYAARRRDYDFDIVVHRWPMSLSPGTEQWLYFGSGGREHPGTKNYMGVASPAVDAMIRAILAAKQPEAFQTAVRALDRVLTAGVYVIPFGVLSGDRLVWQSKLEHPARESLYGWWGWNAGPGRWWQKPPPG